MPIFEHTSGFQILGGTFYEVAGDVHVHNAEAQNHQLNISLGGASTEDSMVVGSDPNAIVWPSESHTAQSGVIRNTRRAISARNGPYGELKFADITFTLAQICSDTPARLPSISRNSSRRIAAPPNPTLYTNSDATSGPFSAIGIVEPAPSHAHSTGDEMHTDLRPSLSAVPDPVPTIHGGTFITTHPIQRRGELGPFNIKKYLLFH
jgi:hypothetical protein